MKEFSVLICPATDLPGQWVSHCLNWDLVSQGNSPSHAAQMVAEAIGLAMHDDAADDLDPDERRPAPAEFWTTFQRVMFDGLRISPSDIDKLKESTDHIIAAVMYVRPAAEEREEPLPRWVPPPLMSAQLMHDSNHAANG